MRDDITDIFDAHPVPAHAPDLKARILAQAVAAEPEPQPAAVNDNTPRRWAGLAAIAAAALLGVFVWTGQMAPSDADEAEEWTQLADAAGFGDLYAWVEGAE